MTPHDTELLADINAELTDGNWPDALEWASSLDENSEQVRARIQAFFGVVECPHCEGKSDDEFGGCPCCDAFHFIDADTLAAWRRDPRNPDNAPHHFDVDDLDD